MPYDLEQMQKSPEWAKMSQADRDWIIRQSNARNTQKGYQPPSGPSLPVYTPSSVETTPGKADPNAPAWVPPAKPELEPGGGMEAGSAQAQDEAEQQAALEKAYPGYQAGWKPNLPGLGPTTLIPGARTLSDVTGRTVAALGQVTAAPTPMQPTRDPTRQPGIGTLIPGGQALSQFTGPISGEAYKAGRATFPQTPEQAGFDAAAALVTAGELGLAERTAVRGFAAALKAGGMAEEDAGPLAEALGGKWIDSAMRAKRAGIPIRMLTMGTGRGLGSVAGGGPFWGPFAKGTFYGGLGELGAGGIGTVSSFVGKDWLVDKTVSDLGEALAGRDVVPELRGLPLGTKGGWEYTFTGTNSPAVKQLSGELKQLEGQINGRIQTLPFKTQKTFGFTVGPPGAKQFHSWTFDEAREEIEHLNDIGWSEVTGAKRYGLSGKAARDASYDLRDQLASQLNRFFPKRPGETAALGDQWLQMRKRFGLVKDISREITAHSQDIFRDPNKVQAKLQEMFGQGPVAESVVDMLGSDAHRDVMTVIRRGLPDPAYDQPGRSLGLGISAHPGGIRPHITIPHPYRGVGGVPLIMNPPAAPFAVAAGRNVGRMAPYLLGEKYGGEAQDVLSEGP